MIEENNASSGRSNRLPNSPSRSKTCAVKIDCAGHWQRPTVQTELSAGTRIPTVRWYIVPYSADSA